MTGWLIVNSFMDNDKFNGLYHLLDDAFKKRNVTLLIKRAADISLEVGTIRKDHPDFAIFWDKDIYLAERLERSGIRLFNKAKSILLCDNKILMYEALKEANIRIPKTFIAPKTFEGLGYTNLTFLEEIKKEISYPFVLKEAYGSFGEQVYLVHSDEQFKEVVDRIGYKDFLIQEYIASSKGKDVRINVIGNKAIVSMLRENINDFRSNISSGGTGKKYEPKQSFIDLAVKASDVLDLDFAGVDVMFDKDDEPIICELNSNPQFASTLNATGINLADYIADYIINSL